MMLYRKTGMYNAIAGTQAANGVRSMWVLVKLGWLLSRVEEGNDQWWKAEEAGGFGKSVYCN